MYKRQDYAILTGQKQKFIGVPKTIDNDLALTDHTPGFGSAAKYIGASTKEVIRDAEGLTYKKKMITIMEIMGRNAGWLTGAAALAKTEDCEGPDLIYLPEIPFDVEKFLAKVKDLLTKMCIRDRHSGAQRTVRFQGISVKRSFCGAGKGLS